MKCNLALNAQAQAIQMLREPLDVAAAQQLRLCRTQFSIILNRCVFSGMSSLGKVETKRDGNLIRLGAL